MRNSTCYKIYGTKTFRLASAMIMPKKVWFNGKTKTKGWGGNLANVEKSLRQIYIPDPGKIFVQVDQSGAEALIVAHLCRDGNYRALFKNGIKPHSYIAMHLFTDVWPKKMVEHRLIQSTSDFDIQELIECPIPQLKQHPFWRPLDSLIKKSDNWALTERYYYLGKQTEHSSNYDIKAPTFQMNILVKSGGKIVIDREQAERFLAIKHALYPEIKEDFHANVRRQAEATKILYNLLGHPYCISDYDIRESDWKEYYAWIPQSTVGEITNTAYHELQALIEENKLAWDLLANTHDSYMCQCPIGEERECAQTMQRFINRDLVSPFDGTQFQMKSEAVAGYNWAPHDEKKNPLGLKAIE